MDGPQWDILNRITSPQRLSLNVNMTRYIRKCKNIVQKIVRGYSDYEILDLSDIIIEYLLDKVPGIRGYVSVTEDGVSDKIKYDDIYNVFITVLKGKDKKEISKWIYPRLLRYKKINNGIPGIITKDHGDMAEKMWNRILDKMLLMLKYINKDIDDPVVINEGIHYLSKYFNYLWI